MSALASQSGDTRLDQFFRWLALRPGLVLTFAVLAALGPFITKSFNMDDPLFLWAARQIQSHPGSPYGFDVNWYGNESPMWEVTKNPPLACYYLAGAAALLGWSEPALHFAFLLPAVAAILGIWRLARHFCSYAVIAACATLFTPVFLVSGTTVMCDTLMLAFWVWAVVLWVEGLECEGCWRLVAAGLLVALAALTKYFGACLVPLLIGYSIFRRQRIGLWAGCLLVPIAALAAYQWGSSALYGKALPIDAAGYVSISRDWSGFLGAVAGVTTLAFTGGCLAVTLFLAPLLWRPRVLAGFTVLAMLMTWALFLNTSIARRYGEFPGASRGWVAVQIAFWAVGGVNVLALAAADVWQRRDARSGLLALWVCGTFLFACCFNWTVSSRSILPMAPAVGILLARRLEQVASLDKRKGQTAVWSCLAAGAALALWVTCADFQLANASRRSAEATYDAYATGERMLWFEGHWGFQYYIEKRGLRAKAVAAHRTVAHRGDLLVIPVNNTDVNPPDRSQAHEWKALLGDGPRWMTTTGIEVGAGFYASVFGPLPFAFGKVPPERVLLYYFGPAPPDEGSP